jgi:hypothetical protein
MMTETDMHATVPLGRYWCPREGEECWFYRYGFTGWVRSVGYGWVYVKADIPERSNFHFALQFRVEFKGVTRTGRVWGIDDSYFRTLTDDRNRKG